MARGLSEHGGIVSVDQIETQMSHASYFVRAIKSLVRACFVRRYDVVIYYGQAVSTLLMLRILCIRGPRLVPYVVEWPPSFSRTSWLLRLNDRYFCALLFRICCESIVISRFLEDKARNLASGRHRVLRVPILCDPKAIVNLAPQKRQYARPVISYCANLNNYSSDVRLVIEAVSQVGTSVDLVLIGQVSEAEKSSLDEFAKRVKLTGSLSFKRDLSQSDLFAEYRAASVLIAPLGDDDCSRARFPSKIADYLLSGTPIVIGPFGEPSFMLENRRSAYIATSHSADGYAEALRVALHDPSATQVGYAGRCVAIGSLNYSYHGNRIMQFLSAKGDF